MIPTDAVLARFKEFWPDAGWICYSHGSGATALAKRTRVVLHGDVWSSKFPPGPRDERLQGWNRSALDPHFPRDTTDTFPITVFRFMGEINIAGEQRGVGRLGADVWEIVKDKKGNRRGGISELYPKSNWRNLNVKTSVLWPGTKEPVATARFEMLREGVQECEARVSIEKALIEKTIDGETQYANTGEVVTSVWNYYVDPFERNRRYICYTDISFARSLDGGKNWIPDLCRKNGLPQNVKNTTYELAFDPEIKGKIWAALSASHDIPNENGVFRKGTPNKPGCVAVSTDFGFTWKPTSLKPNHPVLSVCIDPKSPKDKRTLYAAVFGEGVYRSDDDGATWALKDKGLDEQKRCIKVLAHADGSVFAATTGPKKNSSEGTGLFKSTDRGETWIKISDPKWQWIRDFTVKADDSNTILVPTSRTGPIGLHRSTDGGKTWTTVYTPPGETHFFGAFHSPFHPAWIYLTLGEGAKKNGLYMSKDNGATWVPCTQVPFAGVQRVSFDPDDPAHIYLSCFGASVLKVPSEP